MGYYTEYTHLLIGGSGVIRVGVGCTFHAR